MMNRRRFLASLLASAPVALCVPKLLAAVIPAEVNPAEERLRQACAYWVAGLQTPSKAHFTAGEMSLTAGDLLRAAWPVVNSAGQAFPELSLRAFDDRPEPMHVHMVSCICNLSLAELEPTRLYTVLHDLHRDLRKHMRLYSDMYQHLPVQAVSPSQVYAFVQQGELQLFTWLDAKTLGRFEQVDATRLACPGDSVQVVHKAANVLWTEPKLVA